MKQVKNTEFDDDWTTEMEEISPNVYRISMRHWTGCTVERSGTDPDRLLEDAGRDAREVAVQIQRATDRARGSTRS
jgi:hypothetical protein